MNAQTVIAEWTRDYVAGSTQLTVYAADDVDVVGLVHRAISAENNEWREDGKGFRKGRWFVDASERPYVYVSHEDIPGEVWQYRRNLANWDRDTPNAVRAVGASFHAWHAEMYPPTPTEPMGFGAVVKAGEIRLARALIVHREYPWLSDDGLRYKWTQILERGPVTVLSEGVTS